VSKSLKQFLGEAPEVKTIGASNQVKITTKYKISESDPNVDNEIDSLIFLGVKPFMADGATFSNFQNDYKQSSIKVGPTIAHDIRRDAYIAIFFALIVIFLYILIRFRYWSYSAGGVIALSTTQWLPLECFPCFTTGSHLNLEIDQTFIAAILTIIGYSINDTVIIFVLPLIFLEFFDKNLNNIRVLLHYSLLMIFL